MIREDPYGRCLLDYHHGKDPSATEVYERSDGYVNVGWGGKVYFSNFKDWLKIEQLAMQSVQGLTLDIGCGGGRHSAYLKQQGFEVVAIDNSPGAIQVCRERGLCHAFVLPATQIGRLPFKHFQTILMLGNNFGLCANFKTAIWMLKRLRSITTPDALIVAETRNPYHTKQRVHLRYHRHNRQRSRMAGQVRLRVRYCELKSGWFDYLFVSEKEMGQIAGLGGWRIKQSLKGDEGSYIAILEKLPSE